MLQQISTFQNQVDQKKVNERMPEKAFTTIYWLAKKDTKSKTDLPS